LSTTRIECPNCHRQTIKGKFCIYCGYTLETPQQPKPAPVEEVVQTPEQVPEIVAEASEPAEAAVQTATEEVAVEEKRLVDQLASVYSWYFRLIDLFLEKEADPEVFIELFNEYRGRLKTLNERREAEIKKVEEKINALNTQLDKLRVKHEIGEIPDRQYITQKLEIDREVGRLRPKLMYLRNPFNIRLGDLPAFKNQVEERLNKVKASSGNLGLAEDIINQIEEDTNEVLKVIDVLMEQHHKIRKELNKLELRYKIGELKQSEYLSLKQKLERQLELPGG
jgi:chromosome segregation ATPase